MTSFLHISTRRLLVTGFVVMALAWHSTAFAQRSGRGDTTPRDASLTLTGMVDPPGQGLALAVKNRTAYIAGGPSGIRIIDAKDPSAPISFGSYYGTETTFNVVVAVNTLAAVGRNHAHVLDITAPLTPQFQSAILPTDPTFDTNSSAMLSSSANHLALENRIFDIVPPTAPEEISNTLPTFITGSWRGDSLVHISRSGFDVWRIDVSNPAQPIILTRAKLSDVQRDDIYQSSNLFFVTEKRTGDGPNIFSVLALSTDQYGKFRLLGEYYQAVLDGYQSEKVYLTGLANMLVVGYGEYIRIVSFRDPYNPVLLEEINVQGPVTGLELVNGYLYVLCGTNGLFIFRMDTVR